MTSEIIVDNDIFKIKIGTVDKKNPKTVYYECGTFIEPKENKETYKEDVEFFEKRLKEIAKKLTHSINPDSSSDKLFDKNYIVNFEIAEDRIAVNKKSYLSFQIFLKQINNLSFEDISKYMKTLSLLISTVYKTDIENHGYTCYKTKN